MKYVHPYEDGLDEVLMMHNPKGGKPQKIGKSVYPSLESQNSCHEANELKEETEIRYCLGYCPCSRKIVIGKKRAIVLLKSFQRQGIVYEEQKEPVRLRIAKLLLSGLENQA